MLPCATPRLSRPLSALWLAEFVQMLTSQANEAAKAESKNMITEAHAMKALEELGFGHFCQTADPLPAAPGQPQSQQPPPAERKKKKKAKRGLVSHRQTAHRHVCALSALLVRSRVAHSLHPT